MKIYLKKPKELLKEFIDDYNWLFNINKDKSICIINETIKYYKGCSHKRDELMSLQRMENQWYDALNDNKIDYTIYNDDYYFTDLWACWAIYSRNYLRDIIKPNNLIDGSSLSNYLKPGNNIIDLGCGLGITTASLKQMFPSHTVYGTNIKNTKQWKFCKYMAYKYDFNIIENISNINSNIDLIFASEYFEHIERPIEHLLEIIELNAKILIIANAFNTRSIGHFYNYLDNNTIISQDKISKIFNKTLVNNGYEKIKTKFWNSRPAVYIKK